MKKEKKKKEKRLKKKEEMLKAEAEASSKVQSEDVSQADVLASVPSSSPEEDGRKKKKKKKLSINDVGKNFASFDYANAEAQLKKGLLLRCICIVVFL